MILGGDLIFVVKGQKPPFLAGCSQGPLSGPGGYSQSLAMCPSHTPHNIEVIFEGTRRIPLISEKASILF